MKNFHRIFSFLLIFIITIGLYPLNIFAKENSNSLNLTSEEIKWLDSNKNKFFNVGLDPYSGIEYFQYTNEYKGYMQPLLNIINNDLKINLKLTVSNSWSEIYNDLQNGKIDLLCGANETTDRDKFMSFTKSILRTPYALITKKDNDIHTIGDIDEKTVGFATNDFVIGEMKNLYKNIKYNEKTFDSTEDVIDALRNNIVQAAILSSGPSIYDYLYKYPDLSCEFRFNNLASDMTFSTLKNNKILIDILNKELTYLQKHDLNKLIDKAQIDYYLKIMDLSEAEHKWLENDGTAIMGVTKDYLPFDYYLNGDYKGINGEIINEISKMTGIKFKYVYSDFDDLLNKLKTGTVNVLNVAKTNNRISYIIYTQPYITDRDIIVGRQTEKDVLDIFGLEGKKVAVINGFWHYDLLKKNLSDVKIITTSNIKESMKLVHEGKADYLIENPSVIRYYVEDLQYYDLVQKGNTSNDSMLYFGISKNEPELASIINKTLPILEIEALARKGFEEVPHTTINNYNGLVFTVVALLIILFITILLVTKLVRELVKANTEKKLLKQREYLLSIDSLTELYNRNHFNSKVLETLDKLPFPQALIIADVNNLKVINDTYGHQAGDLLLITFSRILKEACPIGSQIFRMGGDEFFIVISGSNEIVAANTINLIRDFVKSRKFIFKDSIEISPSAALGYSIRYSPDISFEDLYKNADLEMYTDKKNSKL
jgi:diguanylate cyclase (GGDEF) domain